MRSARHKAKERIAKRQNMKVATYKDVGVAAETFDSMQRFMLENFGMSAATETELPEGAPSEEFLIEFGVRKTR